MAQVDPLHVNHRRHLLADCWASPNGALFGVEDGLHALHQFHAVCGIERHDGRPLAEPNGLKWKKRMRCSVRAPSRAAWKEKRLSKETAFHDCLRCCTWSRHGHAERGARQASPNEQLSKEENSLRNCLTKPKHWGKFRQLFYMLDLDETGGSAQKQCFAFGSRFHHLGGAWGTHGGHSTHMLTQIH